MPQVSTFYHVSLRRFINSGDVEGGAFSTGVVVACPHVTAIYRSQQAYMIESLAQRHFCKARLAKSFVKEYFCSDTYFTFKS